MSVLGINSSKTVPSNPLTKQVHYNILTRYTTLGKLQLKHTLLSSQAFLQTSGSKGVAAAYHCTARAMEICHEISLPKEVNPLLPCPTCCACPSYSSSCSSENCHDCCCLPQPFLPQPTPVPSPFPTPCS